jgi:hypothetical protein
LDNVGTTRVRRGDRTAAGLRDIEGKLVVGPEFFEPLSDEECGLGSDKNASP